MKKITFLRKLKKTLEVMDAIEAEEIVNEYKEYIEAKMKKGISEEEAVATFGDPVELGEELLRSYRKKIQKRADPIGDFTKKIMDTIDKIIQEISQKNATEIAQFVGELIVILLIIAICRLPVSFLIDLGKEIFNILSNPLNRIFYLIWRFVLEFSYVIFSILVFVRIFDYRFLNEKKEKTTLKENPVKERKEIKERKEEKRKSYYVGESIIKVLVFLLKLFSIFILFGVSCYLIGMGVVLAICVYLLIQGVTYYGIYIVMLSLFLLGTIFFSVLFNFVIDKKNNGIHLFVHIMLAIFLLGVGVVLATFEVSETEFINGVPNDLNTETLTEELTMTKDTVFIGNIAHYNVDNSLNIIKVDYEYYPIGTTMSTAVRKDGNFVYLRWNLKKIHVGTELLKHMIHDLKEKKVYNYNIEPTIIITASEDNIARIKKNRQKYYANETNYSSCEFVRTYQVEMVKDSKNENEMSVVLSEYLEDDLTTIHLKREWAEDLEVGSSYEFTFRTFQPYIDTDIDSIFEENEVIQVKKTDKVGMEQRKDSSCTIFY